MAHLNVLKQTLSSDLKGLITHVTGLEENSPEFAKHENATWSNIVHRYCPTVSRQKVLHTIEEFVEKFKVHGFPQKAKNLRLLINHYSKLEYFKEHAETGDLQWGILEFLIKLSHKPTNALEDAKPIVLPLTKQAEKKPPFDWGAYLKEGIENFRLPSSDGEESIWELSSSNEGNQGDTTDENVEDSSEAKSLSLGDERINVSEQKEGTDEEERAKRQEEELEMKKKEEALEELKLNLACEDLLEQNFQVGWWDDTGLREIPLSKHPSANYCFIWEEIKQSEPSSNVKKGDTRILSEYKVMRELIWLLGRPDESFIVLKLGKIFTAREMVSISSLSPDMFHDVLEGEICPYLPMIAELSSFVEEITFADKFDLGLTYTYQAYAAGLGEVLKDYRDILCQLEREIVKQNESYTMLQILAHMKPWLRNMGHVYKLHIKAVYCDWKQRKNWICAARLITVLFEEISLCINEWTRKTVLRLFLKSIRPYFVIIDIWMGRVTLSDPKLEFIITRPDDSPEIGCLEMRNYKEELSKLGITETSFLDAIGGIAFRAGASVDFLVQLEKDTEICVTYHKSEGIFMDLIENLKKHYLSLAMKAALLRDVEKCNSYVPFEEDGQNRNIADKWNEGLKEMKVKKEETVDNCLLDSLVSFEPLSVIHPPDYYVKPFSLMDSAFEHYYKPRQSIWTKCPVDELLDELKDYEFGSLPIEVFILREAHDAIGRRMMPKGFAKDILLGEHKLLENLKALRGVYFLQAGRAMHLFITDLFKEMRESQLHSVAWTMKLRDVLNDDYPSLASKFSVTILRMPSEIFLSDLVMVKNIDILFQPGAPLNLIITNDIIKKYNDLFQFFLQLKSSLYLLLRLNYKEFSNKESVLIRRLFSIRIWLLHTINCLHTYFITVQTSNFEKKIEELCGRSRDLHAIEAEHERALEVWKAHCFLTSEHPCKDIVQRLFVLCERVRFLWAAGLGNLLAESQMTAMEKEYEQAVLDLANAIHSLSTTHLSEHFDILHDEIMNNLPSRVDKSEPEIDASSFS